MVNMKSQNKKRKKTDLGNIKNKKPRLFNTEIGGQEENVDNLADILPVRSSEDVVPKKVKWTNKQRVLIFASRGIHYRHRHLMEDIRTLIPHYKSDNKKDKKEDLHIINEMAEMKNCNKCIFFECKKQKDLYMWISNISKGPSVKFLVQNFHTKDELKFTGNSLNGSRPFLSFDKNFSSTPHLELIQEVISQAFNAPKGHPKTQPFFDRVFVFSVLDDRIWFRNYQLIEEDGQLCEIGPRFVLNPIKIFDGSFGGATLWSNSKYITPTRVRTLKKDAKSGKYISVVKQKIVKEDRKKEGALNQDITDELFSTEIPDELKKKKEELINGKKINKKFKKNKKKLIKSKVVS